MNERTLRVLDFPKIVHQLKSLTTFAPGAELAESLHPHTSPDEVQRLLEETAQAARLLREAAGRHPVAGAKDVRPAVERASRGGLLTGPELLDIAHTAAVIGGCRRLLGDHQSEIESPWPRLANYSRRLGDFEALERAVRRCIGDDGDVLDRASEKLARVRAQIRTWQARSRERLDAIVRSAASRQVLQEALVTVRNDRYVVPVKVEHKAAVPGIVHDTSSSGATVFVEPMAVVELNNKIKAAQSEEAREVERILRELSVRVADDAPGLLAAVDALARLDLALAKALLADQMNGVQPVLSRSGRLELLRARHPLLVGDVVPIDVWLGQDFHVLVITGPNTGGKTVTLKTMGLFCLMAQSGLFVPAARAELPVYRGIFADIGDEQGIEQNLSTFSGHMTHIVDILAAVDDQSLVLLDELGAGTDPAEGASLAMAILQHLADLGVSTVATTHYSELKAFVHGRTDMQNASVEFDPKTLAPTYRLVMGTPGRSNALEIAARLGLPSSILAAARGQFSDVDDIRTEDLLRDLEQARREVREEREAARRLREQSEALRARLEATETELRARRDEWERQARSEAERVLTQGRQEVESIIAELRRRGDAFGVEQAREAHRRLGRLVHQVRTDSSTAKKTGTPVATPFVPRPGEEVRVLTLGQIGTVQSGPDADDQWTVQVGSMRVVAPVTDLAPAADKAVGKLGAHREGSGSGRGRSRARSGGGSELRPVKRAAIAPEISLRGMMVDDALYTLEKYLDDALLAGLDRVLVVHGKGTGTLRRAVHDYVKDHPHVTNWYIADQAAGGYGATVVEL